jgi:AcrR family transcriptional regulator
VPKLPDHMQAAAPVGQEQISREVLSEHQRERILVLVTEVFAKRGYQGTTVDDMLAAGKVGVGNFYSLFEGKEDCFLAAYDRIVTNARAEIAAATSSADDWAGQGYLGLRALLEALLARPLEARLALVEAQGAGPAAIARYNGEMDAAIEWLRRGRDHYPQAKKLPAGFEQAAVSGLAFYLQQCLLDSKKHSLEELLAETSASLLEPVVGAKRLADLRRQLNAVATA